MTKVLLVDDEKEFVSALAERLTLRGYEADWTVTAEEALDMVKAKDYDVCLLDMRMPRLSGVELKREIKKTAPGMRFIFLTGHGSEKWFEEASSESAFCLIKPVKVEQVMKAITEAAKGREGGQA
jgi:DNA-binding NtrC family response regulator